jgi:hypothetical protein
MRPPLAWSDRRSLPHNSDHVGRAELVELGLARAKPGSITDYPRSPMSETYLSPETHARLAEELEDLTTRGRIDIARAIEAARALGDLSENGDYHAAKDAQGKMEARIRQLQATGWRHLDRHRRWLSLRG